MLDYPLSVFHSEILLQIYSKTITVMIGVNFAALLLMNYVIIIHGQALQTYRWLLLLSFFISYIVDVVLALGHIVAYLPATIFYFDGLLGKYMDSQLLLSIFFTMITIKLLVLLSIVFYRFAMSFPGPLQDFMSVPRNLIFIVGIHAAAGFSVMFVMLLDREVSGEMFYRIFKRRYLENSHKRWYSAPSI